MTTADDIVTYARTWIGARWQHQARGENFSIDCAGLLIMTARHFDLPHGDMIGYRREPGKEFLRHIRSHTLKAPGIIHGAIGVFNDSIQPCHTGIFAVDADTGRITLIHSEAIARGCHEEDFETLGARLSDKLVAVRLFKGVDYNGV